MAYLLRKAASYFTMPTRILQEQLSKFELIYRASVGNGPARPRFYPPVAAGCAFHLEETMDDPKKKGAAGRRSQRIGTTPGDLFFNRSKDHP
jgi:hypothetical protein